MTRTWSKAIVFAVAVVFAAAPFVFAQTSGSGSATTGTQPYSSSTTTSSQSSQMSTMGAQETLHATVENVDHRDNTLKLKMQDGKTVEFKVPAASLANLTKGDSVQVSIHKAEAGMGTQPSSSMGTQPSRTAPSTSGSSTSGSSTSPSR